MTKQTESGVYKLKGGNWAYRYTIMRNGQRKDVRRARDEFGNPFVTKKEALKARQIALEQEQDESKPKPKERKTVAEVFMEYCEQGRSGKAYQTIRKQDSLWEIHLRKKFGKPVSTIPLSCGDVRRNGLPQFLFPIFEDIFHGFLNCHT